MVESSCWPMEVDGVSAAQRRRQRRLRSWWRHEQQTVAAVFATFQHHSAPRGPKRARTEEEENDTATIRTHPLPQSELFSLYEEAGGPRPASSRGAAAARASSAAHSGADRGVRARGADSRRFRAAHGDLYPCCAGAGDRSASSRSSCRGACGSCPGPAEGLPVVGRPADRTGRPLGQRSGARRRKRWRRRKSRGCSTSPSTDSSTLGSAPDASAAITWQGAAKEDGAARSRTANTSSILTLFFE